MDFYIDRVTRVRGVPIYRLVSLETNSVTRATLEDIQRLRETLLGVKTSLGLCSITYRQLPHLHRLWRSSNLLKSCLPQTCRPIIDQNMRFQLANDDSLLLLEVGTPEGDEYLTLGMTLSGTLYTFLSTKKDFRGSYVLLPPEKRVIFRHRLENNRTFSGVTIETYSYKAFIQKTLTFLTT